MNILVTGLYQEQHIICIGLMLFPCCYRLSVSDIDDATALIIYGRASLFEDNELASTMLSRAARVPLHQIPRGTLKELSTSALELLVSAEVMRG